MMLDNDISSLLAYTEARAKELGAQHGLDYVAEQLGYSIKIDDESAINHTTKQIYLRAGQSTEGRYSDLAHEIGHALAREGDPSWASVIQYRHASVSDMHAHQEALTDLQGDLLRMPDKMVKSIVKRIGLNARAVWVLHQKAEVYLYEALRRIVHYNEDGRMGGFIARRGLIEHAYSYRWRMPCWKGDKMPTPEDGFEGDDVSLFEVPGYPGTFIGLVVIEE